MKEALRPFLLPAIVLLLLVGCGTNPDAAHLYQLEKLFYQAERERSLTAIKPAGPSEADWVRIAGLYQKVVDYHSAVKDEFRGGETPAAVNSAEALAAQSSLQMAALLGPTEQSARATEIYRRVPDDFPRASAYHSIAVFELARLFGQLGQWDSSFAVYHRLLYTHRCPADTLSGYDLEWLEIPLQVAKIYTLLDQEQLAADWLDTGLVFYQRLAREYGIGTVNTLVKTNTVRILRIKQDFRGAIEVCRTITDSAGQILPQAQVEIGDLFYEKMNMPDSALSVFKTLVAFRPDTPAATIAQTKIAAIYIDQGKYQEARDLLRPLKETYQKKGQMVAGIQLLLGRTYELEGAWDRALNEYSWLVGNFPQLKQSLDVFLHVITQMVAGDNLSIARQWQKKARQHFETLIAENPGTDLAAAAQTNLARSHLILEEWEPAAREFQILIDSYRPTPSRLKAYLQLSGVYADRLGDPKRGAAVLRKLLVDFPNFRRKDEIQNRIDFLQAKES